MPPGRDPNLLLEPAIPGTDQSDGRQTARSPTTQHSRWPSNALTRTAITDLTSRLY